MGEKVLRLGMEGEGICVRDGRAPSGEEKGEGSDAMEAMLLRAGEKGSLLPNAVENGGSVERGAGGVEEEDRVMLLR